MLLKQTNKTPEYWKSISNCNIIKVKPGERIRLLYTSRIDECNRRKAQAFISYSGPCPKFEEEKEGQFPQQKKVCYVTLEKGCSINVGLIVSSDGLVPKESIVLYCE